MTTEELIKKHLLELISHSKESLGEVKVFAIKEAWKILQLLTATVVQVIEKIGTDLAGPEKKKIAMNLIAEFYDAIFQVIDLPFLPSAIESLLHSYIKKILMILVDSAIDAMVTTFRDVGVFTIKAEPPATLNAENIEAIEDFLKNLNNIVRVK